MFCGNIAECAAKDNVVILMGEITTRAQVDFRKVVSSVAQRIGYDDITKGKHTV